MMLRCSFEKKILYFKFKAGTSRGFLQERIVWYITLWNKKNPDVRGIGECAPLPQLSTDDRPDFESYLKEVCKKIERKEILKDTNDVFTLVAEMVEPFYPSIRLGLETALLDLKNGGKKIIFNTSFTEGHSSLPVNGLIWMGSKEFMREQIDQKIKEGFRCIKLKIGGISFEQECDLLKYIREKYYDLNIEIRLDANGAFTADHVQDKLNKLEKYHIHSIEQPIAPKQGSVMKHLCQQNKKSIPIALDEELIGIHTSAEKLDLLSSIQPSYIILKPTLVGGFQSCREWITIAENLNISWWITSALESNIGLNAIAQFTSTCNNPLPQGLGTGSLFINNCEPYLKIENGFLSV